MPLYDYRCSGCGNETEIYRYDLGTVSCEDCGNPMTRLFTAPPMVKITGEGGYPSRRKQVFNTTHRNHPPLEHKPKSIYL